MIKVQIKNLKQIQKAFRKAPVDLANNLQEAVKKSGYQVEAEAKPVTPFDLGTLQRSIRTTIGSFKATIKPNTDYADYVHEGTSRMAPRPYMRWGLDKAQGDIDRFFKEALDKTLKGIKRRSM